MRVYKVKRNAGDAKPDVRISIGQFSKHFAEKQSTWDGVPELVATRLADQFRKEFKVTIEKDSKGVDKEVPLEKILEAQAKEV